MIDRGQKPPNMGPSTPAVPRSEYPVCSPSLITKLFRPGVFEGSSGIYFSVQGEKVIAKLGNNTIELPHVSAQDLKDYRRQGAFSREFEEVFTSVVIPQLIAPFENALRENVRRIQEGHNGESIKNAQIESLDPLTISLKGVVLSGRFYSQVEGTVTWSRFGEIAIEARGVKKIVPLGEILRIGDGIILRGILHHIAKLYS